MATRSPVDSRRLLGRGWSLPLTPNRAGALPYADGPEKVRQAILIIVETEPGERLMRPDFGCGLRTFLMKPNTAATRALIQQEVARALALWEGRIDVESVAVTPGDDPALVIVEIAYAHLLDGRRDTLVYPFYLE
jgi:hypothetical protein